MFGSGMGNSAQTQSVVRFQDFQVNLETGEVWKAGVRLKVQDQPFKVLTALLQRPGQIVTREELRQLIWPNESFGDFDHAVNLAIAKLRASLGDSAEVPHLIETLPRRGYRFIAPVENPGAGIAEPNRSAVPPSTSERTARFTSAKRLAFLFSFLGFLVVAALIFWLNLRSPLPVPRVIDSVQITNDVQITSNESSRGFFRLVRDGTRLYFQASFAEGSALVQASTQGGEIARIPTALEEPLAYDGSPVRPELLAGGGAFQGMTPDRPLWVVPLPAGPPHRMGDIIAHDACWAPDGSRLVFANKNDLFVVKPDGSQVRKLAASIYANWMRFSPDGTRLRFNVFDESSVDIFEMGVDGRGMHRLLSHACCGAWSSDGKYYFYHSGNDFGQIWVLPQRRSILGAVESSTPVQLTAGPVPFYGATTLSADGKQLFVVGIQPRVELVHYESRSKQFTPFLGGISAEELEVSRNGQWVAYTTVPEFNLWRSKFDGSERVQLTFPPMKAHEPRWSPDGTQILFTHQPNSDIASKIFVVPADGGAPKQLMPEVHLPGAIGAGAWLPDGNSIVFAQLLGCGDYSCVNGRFAIYKLDLKNQHVSEIPGSDGMYSARVSPDGRYVTALSTNQNKVMLYDFQTERWSELTQCNCSINWSHDSKFVYLVRKQEAQPAELVRISVPEGKIERVLDLKDVTLGGFWSDWISLLPDDSPLLMLDRSRPEIYRLELQYR